MTDAEYARAEQNAKSKVWRAKTATHKAKSLAEKIEMLERVKRAKEDLRLLRLSRFADGA
jgi:hypothetical protein